MHLNNQDLSYISYTDDPTWQVMAMKAHQHQSSANKVGNGGNSGVLYEQGSRF
jgi:hypothetical protein